MIINKGFKAKREKDQRLPPGQYETKDFPVLSLGPTPYVEKENWSLRIYGLCDSKEWNFEEFSKLPQVDIHEDIHCVTKWSKFDTNWKGVSLDEIIKQVNLKPEAKFLIAHSYDGYSTNIPLEDITNMQAIVASSYENKDIPSEHGGPVRLVIPHLYFWKSAKWLKALEFVGSDQPGFWEIRGYHNYGDPWKEQRYTNDE